MESSTAQTERSESKEAISNQDLEMVVKLIQEITRLLEEREQQLNAGKTAQSPQAAA
jgi:hypothetical protein